MGQRGHGGSRRAGLGEAWIWFLSCQVTAHWEKFMASLSPEEGAKKAQADFVRSAVRDVRYGPESLSEFTQWRVRPHSLCWESIFPAPCRLPCPELPWRSLAMRGCGEWGRSGKAALLGGKAFSQLRKYKLPLIEGLRRGWGPQDCAPLPDGLGPPRYG